MNLRELFTDAAFAQRHGGLAIGGIAADSRKVKPGDAFVAVPGTKADGLQFVAAGAVAIVAETPPASPLPDGVAFVRVADARRALARAFTEDTAKVQQWNSFVEDVAFQPGSLAGVVRDLTAFLMPHAATARTLGGGSSA